MVRSKHQIRYLSVYVDV